MTGGRGVVFLPHRSHSNDAFHKLQFSIDVVRNFSQVEAKLTTPPRAQVRRRETYGPLLSSGPGTECDMRMHGMQRRKPADYCDPQQ